MREVLIIVGQGRAAFGNKDVNKLFEGISNIDNTKVVVIGDAEQGTSIEQIREELLRLSDNANNITIFILAHGTIKNQQFHFETSDDKAITSKELFGTIGKELGNKKIDMFITSCHSGVCLQDKELLPKGSVVATVSQGQLIIPGKFIYQFIYNINFINDDVTTYNLLELYCTFGLTARIPPEFGIAGEDGTIQLDELLKSSLGKELNRKNVQLLLTQYIKSEELEQFIERMQNAKNEYEIMDKDYGKALAICLASKFGNNITCENYIPFTSEDKGKFDDPLGFLRTVDSRVSAISRKNALENLKQAFIEKNSFKMSNEKVEGKE